jgi:hypothetical protein
LIVQNPHISGEAIRAVESQDTYNLPAGITKWRFSNAISWIAGQTKDEEKKLDLMKIAGRFFRLRLSWFLKHRGRLNIEAPSVRH